MKGGDVTKSQKTATAASTTLASSKEDTPKTTRGKKTFRSITAEHVHEALTYYLRTMSILNGDEEVTLIFKTPEGYDLKIGNIND